MIPSLVFLYWGIRDHRGLLRGIPVSYSPFHYKFIICDYLPCNFTPQSQRKCTETLKVTKYIETCQNGTVKPAEGFPVTSTFSLIKPYKIWILENPDRRHCKIFRDKKISFKRRSRLKQVSLLYYYGNKAPNGISSQASTFIIKTNY